MARRSIEMDFHQCQWSCLFDFQNMHAIRTSLIDCNSKQRSLTMTTAMATIAYEYKTHTQANSFIHSKMFPINRIQKLQQQTAASHSMHVVSSVYVCVCVCVRNNNRFLLFVHPSKSFNFKSKQTKCRRPKLDGCLACIHHFGIDIEAVPMICILQQIVNSTTNSKHLWWPGCCVACVRDCVCVKPERRVKILNFAQNCNKCLAD